MNKIFIQRKNIFCFMISLTEIIVTITLFLWVAFVVTVLTKKLYTVLTKKVSSIL